MEFIIILIFLFVIFLCVIFVPFIISWKYLENTNEGRKRKLLNKIKKEKRHKGIVVVVISPTHRNSIKTYHFASKILLTMSSTFTKRIKVSSFGKNGTKFQVGKDVLYVSCGDIQFLDTLKYQVDKIYFDSDFTPQVQKMLLKSSLFKRNKATMDWDIFFEDEKNSSLFENERISFWLKEQKERMKNGVHIY